VARRDASPSPSAGEGQPAEGRQGEGPSRPITTAPLPAAADSHPLPQRGEGFVLLGEFGRSHGLRGEVRLKSFTADPASIGAYGPLRTEQGRPVVLVSVRPAGGASPDMLVARVEGVATRAAAEALNRVRLYAARDQLGTPEADDEFFAADLIGLPVQTRSGDVLGAVAAVPNYGGGDLLEIAPAGGGPTALLPFTKAFVPAVDFAAKRVVIDPPDDLFTAGADDRD
jgi:16S rRNA processing protein RimM